MSHKRTLKGQTAIVTGSGTGIGRELALEFARHGMNLALAGRRQHELAETARLVQKAGAQVLICPTDVADRQAVDRLVAATLGRFGAIDVLYNNAGSFRSVGPLWEADPEAWWSDVTTNLYGPMLCCRAVLPHMMKRNSGTIINMDGGGSTQPNVGGSAYASSKTGLLRLTETLAWELARVGSKVLVFAMNPGFVDTPMTRGLTGNATADTWQAFVKEAFERHQGYPPDACAKAVIKLLAIAGPDLAGRRFAVEDDFDAIAARRQQIREQGLYVLRLTSPPASPQPPRVAPCHRAGAV